MHISPKADLFVGAPVRDDFVKEINGVRTVFWIPRLRVHKSS